MVFDSFDTIIANQFFTLPWISQMSLPKVKSFSKVNPLWKCKPVARPNRTLYFLRKYEIFLISYVIFWVFVPGIISSTWQPPSLVLPVAIFVFVVVVVHLLLLRIVLVAQLQAVVSKGFPTSDLRQVVSFVVVVKATLVK